VRAAAILLALVACAKSADELSPFPCALDGSCPGGLACVQGTCAAPELDALCTTGDDPTDCSAAAAGAICAVRGSGALGAACTKNADCLSGMCASDGTTLRCSQACNVSSPNCPTGFACLSAGATGACFGSSSTVEVGACEIPCAPGCPNGRACSSTMPGAVCLVDCTGDGSCPGGTTCRSRNFDTVKVCAPPGVEIAECQNVISPVVCNMCGQPSIADVLCPDGKSTCPHGSTCSADSTSCTCDVGTKALDCSGTMCNGQCSGSNWWCQPDVAATSCESDRFALSGTCHCYDGRNLNFSCTAAMSCEAACEQ
jgi:hypothetical protein